MHNGYSGQYHYWKEIPKICCKTGNENAAANVAVQTTWTIRS